MKTLMLALALVGSFGGAAFAQEQEVREVRFYIVPKTSGGPPPMNGTRPKYFRELEQFGARPAFQAIDYGLEDAFLVAATVSPQQHTALVGNIDVIALPQDLDAPIGPVALTTVKSKMAGLRVPNAWIEDGRTYREILAATARTFQFSQRYHAMFNQTPFDTGAGARHGLDARISALNTAQRSRLQQTAISLGLDFSGITNQHTIGEALKLLADQFPPVFLGGEQF